MDIGRTGSTYACALDKPLFSSRPLLPGKQSLVPIFQGARAHYGTAPCTNIDNNMYCQWSGGSIMRDRRISCARLACDLVALGTLLILLIGLYVAGITGRIVRRGFFCDDESLHLELQRDVQWLVGQT